MIADDSGKPILTTKQRQAIGALLTERTIAQAAQKIGVSAPTVQRWLRDESFVAELRAVQADLLQAATVTLATAQADSLKTLEDLRDNSSSDTVRLGAARTLVELFFKFRENSDIEERLQALEAAIHEAHQTT